MRRAIALSLMMLFSLTLIAPLLASETDANLPPCCRRHGKHHCMMRMMERQGGGRTGLRTVSERCPCSPAGSCAVQSAKYKPESQSQLSVALVQHSLRLLQTGKSYRAFFLRAYQKRGPPTPLV